MALFDPGEFPREFPVEVPAINDVADKLARSRELVERGWCQDESAADARGRPVASCSDAAVSFCMVGATFRACGNGFDDARATWGYIEAAIGTTAIEDWNDTPGRTQAEVVEAFRKAEAIARGEA